jgi:hypothetical protein
MAVTEVRERRAIKESKSVKFRERFRDLIVVPVDLANPVHQSNLISLSERRLHAKPDRTDKARNESSASLMKE